LNLKFISYLFISFILIILVSVFSYASYSNATFLNPEHYPFYFSNSNFFWPVPGFNTITSPFGERVSPINGASTNHSGIDISAPQGSTVYSITSGVISFTGFLGANGFSIIQENNNLTVIYAHVSPEYIVSAGDFISIGKKIGHVGPKYIYNLENNIYTDNEGNPTNGATTRPTPALNCEARWCAN